MVNSQRLSQEGAIRHDLKDPEPVSIAISLLGVLIAGASYVVQIRRERREVKKEKAEVRRHIYEAERAFNRLYMAYRNLINVYQEQGLLSAPFNPAKTPFFVDDELKAYLDRVHAEIYYGGRDLRDALHELVGVLEDGEQDAAALSSRLESAFQEARTSQQFLGFLIQLAELQLLISEFLDEVSERYEVDLISRRPEIEHTRGSLRRRQ